MLKAVKTDPQAQQNKILRKLQARRVDYLNESEAVRVNLLITDLMLEAVDREPMNADLYQRLMDGYISEREFIDALENVSQSLRYHLALAFLDSHNLNRL